MSIQIQQPSLDDQRYERTYGIEKRVANHIKLERPGSSGPASLRIRTEGALIAELWVAERRVLTSPAGDDFEQPVKTDATITMLPVGPSAVGPQHGASRYLDYGIEHSAGHSVKLAAKDTLRGVGHLKTITLESTGLTVTDEVVSNSNHGETGLSLGEHFYFAVEEIDMAGVKFLDGAGAEQLITARKLDGAEQTGILAGFLPELKAGRSIYLDRFNGSQIISIPGLGEVTLQARAMSESQEHTVGLLIWHRPGSNSMCFEPVTGFMVGDEGRLHNDGIVLAPGELVTLVSRVQV